MGAITVTVSGRLGGMGEVLTYGSFTMSNSYATDGDTYVASQFGMGAIRKLFLFPRSGIFVFQDNALKVKVYTQKLRTGSTAAADSTSGALAEIFSAASESAVRLMGSAIDTNYFITQSDEVANTTDLSGQTVDFICLGRP